MTVVGQEGLDTPVRYELAAQSRCVEQLTVQFATSLHLLILDDLSSRSRAPLAELFNSLLEAHRELQTASCLLAPRRDRSVLFGQFSL